MSDLIFITGGARSGKSSFGEKLALERLSLSDTGAKIAYIATAEATDDEFRRRIEHHRDRRGGSFETYEETLELDAVYRKAAKNHRIIILECLTVWLGNVFYRLITENKIRDYVQMMSEGLFREMEISAGKTAIIISNEIGMGIVPADPETRLFRDIQGRLNQEFAAKAKEVYFMVSGIPMKIKG